MSQLPIMKMEIPTQNQPQHETSFDGFPAPVEPISLAKCPFPQRKKRHQKSKARQQKKVCLP